MKCLAVNTANTVLSVALCDGAEVLYYFETPETRDQGNVLLGHARQALETAGIGYDGLDLMAVVTGPGSFTGIRIGLAGMRGLAMAADKPLVGLSSFDLFAETGDGEINIVAVEAWREELYFQIAGQPPVNQSPAVFAEGVKKHTKPLVISGDAAHKLAPFLPAARVVTPPADARQLAQKAMQLYAQDAQAAAKRPAPFYLRPADVTLSAAQNRSIEGQDKP
ncbi:MAG: tRNA (adenosine(37)-N6)-threonylcarbamoyltransferase complex dimerization subunit type 1 TsaB [Alphaproteobacteria bacterium]|nr:tRNA (adenosine(37)-N6)-threonylcarbamoyltransferase complex dimerization subunit type 1 TsaB [Alphaproteobacteria bacterium]